MNALPMLLGGPQRIGLDGIIDSRVLCCIRFVDTRTIAAVSGTFLNGETITIRRAGLVVATAVVDCVLSATKLALHGITASSNSGDAITGDTSGATATASTGAVELVDVGPNKYTITNSGLTAGDVGTGPFVGDRSALDPSNAAYAYVTNAAFLNAKAMFARIKTSALVAGINVKISCAADAHRQCLWFSANVTGSKLQMTCASYPTANTTPNYTVWGPKLTPTGQWNDLYVDFTNGIRLAINGIFAGSQVFSFPLTGTPTLMLGRFAFSSGTYGGAHPLHDVMLFNQNVGIEGGFMPLSRYRYSQ